jgi:hypothetical protein
VPFGIENSSFDVKVVLALRCALYLSRFDFRGCRRPVMRHRTRKARETRSYERTRSAIIRRSQRVADRDGRRLAVPGTEALRQPQTQTPPLQGHPPRRARAPPGHTREYLRTDFMATAAGWGGRLAPGGPAERGRGAVSEGKRARPNAVPLTRPDYDWTNWRWLLSVSE